MLVIGLGIGLIIAGIVALVNGKLSLTKTRAVQGVPARLLGVALMTPMPLGFLVAIIYMLMNVNLNDQQQMDQWAKDNDLTLTLIFAAVEIGLALIILLIAVMLAKPLPEERSRTRGQAVDEYDDFEARPRRRRPVDDEEMDRPQSRRDDLDERSR